MRVPILIIPPSDSYYMKVVIVEVVVVELGKHQPRVSPKPGMTSSTKRLGCNHPAATACVRYRERDTWSMYLRGGRAGSLYSMTCGSAPMDSDINPGLLPEALRAAAIACLHAMQHYQG